MAVKKCGRKVCVDPDVARLEHKGSDARQSRRDALRPVARVLGNPISADSLRSASTIRALVDANSINQAAADAVAAPYLEVSGPDDPRLNVNIRLLQATREVSGGRPLMAYLQVLNRDLLSGSALRAGLALVPHADVIVLRARRVLTDSVSPAQAWALVQLVGRIAQAGRRVIVDCAGDAGAPLVAAGADGFSAGTWRFQKVPADLHPKGGGGGGRKLVHLYPLETAVDSTLPDHDGAAERTKARIRLRNLKLMRDSARNAAAAGIGYADVLARSGQPQGKVWAAELRRLAARAA